MVLGRLDHRDAQRRRIRHARLLVDLGLYAREVAGLEQASLVEDQLLAVVDIAGMQRREIRDQRVVVAPRAGDVQLAQAKRRPARDFHLQRRAMRLRVDARLARGDRRGGVAVAREVAHRLALGRFPFGLAKGLPGPQGPVLAHALHVGPGFAVGARGAAEADVDIAYPRALAGLDAQPHHPRLARGVDLRLHVRREVAVGGGGLARLADRLVHQAPQPLLVHLRIGAPAHDVEPLLEHVLQLARRVDLDAIVELRGRRAGGEDERRERVAHAP